MSILEWFNIHDQDHVRAWHYLSRKGIWPEGFVPEEIEFSDNWHLLIMSKMADAWVSYNL
jgi:hypothetical protein